MAKWGEGDARWIVEERPDGKNVNNWHWAEKNANLWSRKKLEEILIGTKIYLPEVNDFVVTEMLKCDGDAYINNRKGRILAFFEWNIQLKWEIVEHEARGKIIITNFCNEVEMNDVEITVTSDVPIHLSNFSQFMKMEVANFIKSKLTEYLKSLKEDFSKSLILSDNKSPNTCTCNNDVPVKAPSIKHSVPSALSLISSNCGAKEINFETTSYTHREKLVCSSEDAYKCFTDKNTIAAYTRSAVNIDAKPHGKFEILNGNIVGEFIEIEENKHLKLHWRNNCWKASGYSNVELKFEQVDDGTIIDINHSEIPSTELESTKVGWNFYYWQAIKKTFGFGSFITDVLM